MPSFDAIRPNKCQNSGILQTSHPDDFLTAEEQARRQRVLGRIPALSGKHEFTSFKDKTNTQFIKGQPEERVVQNLAEFVPVADTLR